MYDNGIANEHEEAHQKGLTRGFDLGWSYKGRFDRSIIQDRIEQLGCDKSKLQNLVKVEALHDVLKELHEHESNREFITQK